jgi:hypothetical protein
MCGLQEVEALKKTSAIWPQIIETSILSYSGPQNGTTFSSATYRLNGPCFMPHLIFVKIDALDLIDGLEALDLVGSAIKHKSRVLHLIVDTIMLTKPVMNIIGLVPWASISVERHYIDPNRLQGLSLNTLKLSINAELFQHLVISKQLKTLILFGFNSCTYARAFETVFNFDLEYLEMFGVLTDTAIANAPFYRMQSLKHLHFHNEGVLTWIDAPKLQSMFPNVESFSIRSSNLICLDLSSRFDLSMWPNLTEINLEKNYTLDLRVFEWPPNIKSLRILNALNNCMYSRSFKDSIFNLPLERLSVSSNSDNVSVFGVSNLPLLKHLHIFLLTFLRPEHIKNFLQLAHLQILEITFQEKFDAISYLKKIRQICPNTLVVQRNP